MAAGRERLTGVFDLDLAVAGDHNGIGFQREQFVKFFDYGCRRSSLCDVLFAAFAQRGEAVAGADEFGFWQGEKVF